MPHAETEKDAGEIFACIASCYDSDGLGSLHAAVQSRSSCLRILKV